MGSLVGPMMRHAILPGIQAGIQIGKGICPVSACIFRNNYQEETIEKLASDCAEKMGIKKPIHFSYMNIGNSTKAVQAQGSSLFTKKIYLTINTKQLKNNTLELEICRELARIKTNEKIVKPVIEFIAAGVTIVALGLLCPSWLNNKNIFLNPIAQIAGLVGRLATTLFSRWSNEYSFRVAVKHCSEEGKIAALAALKVERDIILEEMANSHQEGTPFTTKIEKYFRTKEGDFIFTGLRTISRSRKITLLEKSLGISSKVSQE